MSIEELLMQSAVLSGFDIYDENEYKRIVGYQIQHQQFQFIEDGHKPIGYFGWLIKEEPEGTCLCINNLFVLEAHKKAFNIFSLYKFFTNRYKNLYKIEWHNQKKNQFKELIIKRGKK